MLNSTNSPETLPGNAGHVSQMPPSYDTPVHFTILTYTAETAHYPPPYSELSNPSSSAPPPAIVTETMEIEEEDAEDVLRFTEKSLRLGFVKKVFGILAVQMVLTIGIVCIFLFVEPIKELAVSQVWFAYGSGVAVLVLMVVLGANPEFRRKSPANFILLFLFTVAMSAMLGAFTCHFEADEILVALGTLLGIVLVMTLLGCQQKIDFSWVSGVVCSLTSALLLYAVMCAIFRTNYMTMMFASLGAFLFSLWLLVDIQMIMGGKHRLQMDPEEYIMAALQLYIDIVYIFIFLLYCISRS